MQAQNTLSENSRNIARNTMFMYLRMFVLLLIGLFTSRVVLKSLGVVDYGTYQAVAGFVMMFNLLTNSVATAISRFITCELEKGNKDKLRDVFATSLTIQVILSIVVIILAETIGLWFFNNRMIIPPDRLGAAAWAFHCSLGILVINLLSVPFNAEIVAHEKMSAYARISILEGFLKLLVAVLLFVASSDKLKVYSLLMLLSALLVRFTYSAYCRKHFEETRTSLKYCPSILKEMTGFAGWNMLSSGVFLINTQGLNILTNLFFGVVANASRGVAAQVEGMVKQFVTNVIVPMNPQITKLYVSGNKPWAFSLVSKGSKYTALIMLFFIIPTSSEADTILHLWLGTVPPEAALFTKLTLVCTALDLLMLTTSTIILADGRIKRFYVTISMVTALIAPVVWLSFRLGAPAYVAYIVFIAVYVVLDGVKLVLLHRTTDYPYISFFKDVILRVLPPAILAILTSILVTVIYPEPDLARMFISLFADSAVLLSSAYFFSLTDGEKQFIKSKLHFK